MCSVHLSDELDDLDEDVERSVSGNDAARAFREQSRDDAEQTTGEETEG